MESTKEHWNKVYESNDSESLGWYEENPAKSLELFEKCGLEKNEAIIDIGCGTSAFLSILAERGFSNLVGVDISKSAIKTARSLFGKKAAAVKWIVDDIGNPKKVKNFRNVSLWHDRAALHFLPSENQIQNYADTLNAAVRKNGYAIMAAFSMSGAKKCSGLDVKNYDQKSISRLLGPAFKLIGHFEYMHHTPSGSKRPYVYTLLKKIV